MTTLPQLVTWCFIDQTDKMTKVTLKSTHVSVVNCFSEHLFFIIKHYLQRSIQLCSNFFARVCSPVRFVKTYFTLIWLQALRAETCTPLFQPETSKILTQMLHMSEFPWKRWRLAGLCRLGLCIPTVEIIWVSEVKYVRGFIRRRPLRLMGWLVRRPLDNRRNSNGHVYI